MNNKINTTSTIIILGADGYIGWPLTMKIATMFPDRNIIAVDSELRRDIVQNAGGNSVTPIAAADHRFNALNSIHGTQNVVYRKMDINSDALDHLIQTERPAVVYHLAQQPSAPWSMKSVQEAIFTLQNNESGNLRLLWAVHLHSPETHIVKLGSMGQYAKSELDIPEGYFFPEYNGKKATLPMPFPREANDVYHITKINDTNFVSMACREWKLRITDIMQSVIFGVTTPESAGHPELFTRFDYDECFGTVVNRFMAQAVKGHPLTVYGTGMQRTGLMPLTDAISSLAELANLDIARGEHKVINHATETNFTINELAEAIKEIGAENGLNVTIERKHNPRDEQETHKKSYNILTHFVDRNVNATAFHDAVSDTLKILRNYIERIDTKHFHPHIHWKKDAVNPSVHVNSNTDYSPTPDNTDYWEQYRKKYFPSERINLNPGTLGTLSIPVKKARRHAEENGELSAFPLGVYENASQKLDEVMHLAEEIWPMPGFDVVVTPSITQIVNLLSINLLRKFYKIGEPPYQVVTTRHEHSGGIGCFHLLSEYHVNYLDDSTWNSAELLTTTLQKNNPVICLLSHVRYDTGNKIDIERICRNIRKTLPDCIIIIDVAQSLGIHELPHCEADIFVSSAHKWLHGPHGGGLMWIRQSCARWLEGIFWDVLQNATTDQIGSFKQHGGQDFSMYASMCEALKLYRDTGKANILNRSKYLGKLMQQQLKGVLDAFPHHYVFLNEDCDSPMISLGFTEYDPYPLYAYLNQCGIHTKCIKNQPFGDTIYHIVRIGLPYYEHPDRITYAVNEVRYFLGGELK